jgi:hypothetical protein
MTGKIRAAVAALTIATLAPGAVLAHGPDPLIPGAGTLWGREQVVPYMWHDVYTPPAWMATAIDLGAGDVRESKAAMAATFVRVAAAPAVIWYGGAVSCSSFGIACADRTGMSQGLFKVQFRPQGWAFDWGTLKWCQFYTTYPTGCYDAERVALDEFGHIEVLGHHVNFADESDFLDAVVQFAGHQKPGVGWNAHAFGRCDVARLQLEYSIRPQALVSTCLDLTSALSLVASTDSVTSGTSVRLTANLRIASFAAAEALAGAQLSDRRVVLQRRAIGTSTWLTIGTMPASSTVEGAYVLTYGPTATYDYRATFATPTNEGLSGATSAIVRVTVTSCTGGGCPLSGGGGPGQGQTR